MDLFLVRKQIRPDGVFGELRDDSGTLIAVTLEHAYGDDQGGFWSKIPDGNFTCRRGYHRLHNMQNDFATFEITGIEGHSNILFHWGNYNADSDGCVLLGEKIMPSMNLQMITNSRDAFSKFMALQSGFDDFKVTVTTQVEEKIS